MKPITSLLLAAFALLVLPACTTTQVSDHDRKVAITGSMLELAGTVFAPVLANNPDYRPVAQAVADALGTVETGTISAESLGLFVGTLAETHKFTAEQKAYAQLLVAAGWNIYTAQTGRTVAEVGNPDIQTWVAAFRRGLITALAFSANAAP